MTDKIALITDEISGKVLGYRADGIDECDTLADKSNEQIIQQACYVGKDVYYLNGQLQVRDKDPNEYNNKRNALCYELSEVRNNIRQCIIDHRDSSELLKQEYRIKTEIEELELKRGKALKAYLTDKVKNANYKYDCCICLIIRNENEYLKEWLEWHVGQGFEHFFIYDHGSEYPVAEFVKTLDADMQAKITVHDFGGTHRFAQHDAYNDCLKRHGSECRWLAYIDADEMIRVRCGCTIGELLRHYDGYAGLFMRWIVYDANGQKEKSDKPLRERFTRVTSAKLYEGIGKVIIRPSLVTRIITHNCFTKPGFDVVDENRSVAPANVMCKFDSTAEFVCVDHYYTKSHEEWKQKIGRGACDPIFKRKYDEFFIFNPDMEYCRENIEAEQKYEITEKIV